VRSGIWREAIVALKYADGPTARVPYDGAAERLMRIHREARDRTLGILAFGALLDQKDIDRVLPYVRAFVTSDQPETADAVSQIIMRSYEGTRLYRPEARALLKELYERDLVPNPEAREVLEGFALGQGWTRRP